MGAYDSTDDDARYPPAPPTSADIPYVWNDGRSRIRAVEVWDINTLNPAFPPALQSTRPDAPYFALIQSTDMSALRVLQLDLLIVNEKCALGLGTYVELFFRGDNVRSFGPTGTGGEARINGTLLVSENVPDPNDVDSFRHYSLNLENYGKFIANSEHSRIFRLEPGLGGVYARVPTHILEVGVGKELYVASRVEIYLNRGQPLDVKGTLTLGGNTSTGGVVDCSLFIVPDNDVAHLMGGGIFKIEKTIMGTNSILYIWAGSGLNTYLTDEDNTTYPAKVNGDGTGTVILWGTLNGDRSGGAVGTESKVKNLLVTPAPDGSTPTALLIGAFDYIGNIYVAINCTLNIENPAEIAVYGYSSVKVRDLIWLNGTLTISPGAVVDATNGLLLVTDNSISQNYARIKADALAGPTPPVPLTVKHMVITSKFTGQTALTTFLSTDYGAYNSSIAGLCALDIIVSGTTIGHIDAFTNKGFNTLRFEGTAQTTVNVLTSISLHGDLKLSTTGLRVILVSNTPFTVRTEGILSGTGRLLPNTAAGSILTTVMTSNTSFTIAEETTFESYINGNATQTKLVLNGDLYARALSGVDSRVEYLEVPENIQAKLRGILNTVYADIQNKSRLTIAAASTLNVTGTGTLGGPLPWWATPAPPAWAQVNTPWVLVNGGVEIASSGTTNGLKVAANGTIRVTGSNTGRIFVNPAGTTLVTGQHMEIDYGANLIADSGVTLNLSGNARIDGRLTVKESAVTVTGTTSVTSATHSLVGGEIVREGASGTFSTGAISIANDRRLTVTDFSVTPVAVTGNVTLGSGSTLAMSGSPSTVGGYLTTGTGSTVTMTNSAMTLNGAGSYVNLGNGSTMNLTSSAMAVSGTGSYAAIGNNCNVTMINSAMTVSGTGVNGYVTIGSDSTVSQTSSNMNVNTYMTIGVGSTVNLTSSVTTIGTNLTMENNSRINLTNATASAVVGTTAAGSIIVAAGATASMTGSGVVRTPRSISIPSGATFKVGAGTTLSVGVGTTETSNIAGTLDVTGRLHVRNAATLYTTSNTNPNTAGSGTIKFNMTSEFIVGGTIAGATITGGTAFLGAVNCVGHTSHVNAVTSGVLEIKIGSTAILYGKLGPTGVLVLYTNPIDTCGFTQGTGGPAAAEDSFDPVLTWAYNGLYSMIEETSTDARILFNYGVDDEITGGLIARSVRAKMIYEGLFVEYFFVDSTVNTFISYKLQKHSDGLKISDTSAVTTGGKFLVFVPVSSDEIVFNVSYTNYYYWTLLGDKDDEPYRFPTLQQALELWASGIPSGDPRGPQAPFANLGSLVAVGTITDNLNGTSRNFVTAPGTASPVTLLLYHEYPALHEFDDVRSPGTVKWTDISLGPHGSITIGAIDTTGGSLTIDAVDVFVNGSGAAAGTIIGTGDLSLTNTTIRTSGVNLTGTSELRVNSKVTIQGLGATPSTCNVTVPMLKMEGTGFVDLLIGSGNLTVSSTFASATDGSTNLTGNLNVRGTFTARGAVFIKEGDNPGSLTAYLVAADSTVSVQGNVVVRNGPLPTSPRAAFTALGNVSITGNLEAGNVTVGSSTLQSALNVDGTARTDNLNVKGTVNVIGNLQALVVTVGQGFIAPAHLIVNDYMTATSITVTGNILIDGHLITTDFVTGGGHLTVGDALSVGGYVDIASYVDVAKDMTVNGSFPDAGDNVAIRAGKLEVTGKLSVTGTNIFIKLTQDAPSRVQSKAGSFSASAGCTVVLPDEHDLLIFGEMNVTGDMEMITGTQDDQIRLDVSGSVTVAGKFSTDNVNVGIGGNLSAHSVEMDGTLNVGSNARIGYMSGTTFVKGNFTVTGDVDIGGSLEANDVIVGVFADPDVTPLVPVTAADLSIGSNMTISSAKVTGSLTVNAFATVENALIVFGPIEVEYGLNAGSVLAGDDVTVNGAVRVGSRTPYVPGPFAAKGDVYIDGTFYAGSVNVGDPVLPRISNLNVTMSANVGELNVTGYAVIPDGLTAAGNVDIGKYLEVEYGSVSALNLTAAEYVLVGGNLNAKDVIIGDTLNPAASLRVTGGSATVDSLIVTGEVEIGNIFDPLSFSYLTVSTGSAKMSKLTATGNIDIAGGTTAGIPAGLTVSSPGGVLNDIVAGGSLTVRAGNVTARDMTVGGNITVRGSGPASGSVTVRTIVAKGNVDIYNSLTATGNVTIGDFTDPESTSHLTIRNGDASMLNLKVIGNTDIIFGNLSAADIIIGDPLSIPAKTANLIVGGYVDTVSAGSILVTGNMIVRGADAGNDAIRSGQLTVWGDLSIINAGNVNIRLSRVSGTSTLGSLTSPTAGTTSIFLANAHVFRIERDVVLEGSLYVESVTKTEIHLEGRVDIKGLLSTLNADVNIDGELRAGSVELIGGDLDVLGNVYVGTIAAPGSLKADNIRVGDPGTSVFSDLTVIGYVEDLETILVNGNMYVTGSTNLPASDHLITAGTLIVANSLHVNNIAGTPVIISLTDVNATSAIGSLTTYVGCTVELASGHEFIVDNDVTAFGDLTIDAASHTSMTWNGRVQIEGDLIVINVDVEIGGNLYVFGDTEFTDGSLTVLGNVTANDISITDGSLTVSGYMTANDVDVTDGSVGITGNMTLTGGIEVNGGDIDVSGNMVAAGDVKVTGGSVTVEGYMNANDVTVTGGSVGVSGNVNANDVTVTGGSISVDGYMNAGDVNVTGGDLTVLGNVNITNLTADNVIVGDPANASAPLSSLTVTGGFVKAAGGEVTVTGNMTVTGKDAGDYAITAGILTVGGKLTVDNTSDVKVSLTLTGEASAIGALDTTGCVFELDGDHGLVIEGDVYSSGRFEVRSVLGTSIELNGRVNIAGDFSTVNVDVTVAGDLYAGNTAIGGELWVKGNATVANLEAEKVTVGTSSNTSNLSVSGYADVTGDISVTGNMTVTGKDALDNALTAGRLDIGGMLSVNNSSTVNIILTEAGPGVESAIGSFSTTGCVFLLSHDLNVTENFAATGSVTMSSVTPRVELTVGGFVNITGSGAEFRTTGINVTVTDNMSIPAGKVDMTDGDLTVKNGNVTVYDIIMVNGTLTLEKGTLNAHDVSVTDGDVLIEEGSATVNNMDVTGSVDIKNSLTVNGTSVNTGVLTLGGMLHFMNTGTTATTVMNGSRIGSLVADGDIELEILPSVPGGNKKIIIDTTFVAGSMDSPTNVDIIGDMRVGTTFYVYDLMEMDGDLEVGLGFYSYGETNLSGNLDIFGENIQTYIHFERASIVGTLKVNNCFMSIGQGGATLTLSGAPGETCILIRENLLVQEGGSIDILEGDLWLGDAVYNNVKLTLMKGNLTMGSTGKSDLIVRGGSKLLLTQGNLEIGKGDLVAESGSEIMLISGNMELRGETGIGGNIYALDVDISVPGGFLTAVGDVFAKSLMVGGATTSSFFDATIGGNLTVGTKGMRVYGNLIMTDADAKIDLYSYGDVERMIDAKNLTVNVFNKEMLRSSDLKANNLTLNGKMTVSNHMTVADTFRMGNAWASLGHGSTAENIVAEGSATLVGGPITSKNVKVKDVTGRLILVGWLRAGSTDIGDGAFMAIDFDDSVADDPMPGRLVTDTAIIDGRLDVLRDGSLEARNKLTVNGMLNMNGTFDVAELDVIGSVFITGTATSTGAVTVAPTGSLNIGQYGLYRDTGGAGKLIMKNGPGAKLDVKGSVWIYGTLDASEIPAGQVSNKGYIWAWATGGMRNNAPYGEAFVYYNVTMNLGIATTGWAVSQGGAQHTTNFVLTLTHDYGYSIQNVKITVRNEGEAGFRELVYGTEYIFDRHTVTIFDWALDGATGDIEITITDAYKPTVMDLIIQMFLLLIILILFLIALWLLRRRKKKNAVEIKRYY
jgi:hypothetical protein